MKNTMETRKRLRVKWRDAESHSEWLDPEAAKKYKPAIFTFVAGEKQKISRKV